MVGPSLASRPNRYAQLHRLETDRSVKAVVLRINSPGGSAAAAQTLYQEIGRVRAAGKIVVVNFGDVAASGGYYVAAGAVSSRSRQP
jgi:protease IV